MTTNPGPGRPRLDGDNGDRQKRRHVRLSDAFYFRALTIGEGNASAGIRRALASYDATDTRRKP